MRSRNFYCWEGDCFGSLQMCYKQCTECEKVKSNKFSDIQKSMKDGRKNNGAKGYQGQGAKKQYSEETETVAFRVPTSKIPEVKKMVKRKLKTYKKK